MHEHIEEINKARNQEEVCIALHGTIDSLRKIGYLACLSSQYEKISAKTPQEIQDWFDIMKEDKEIENDRTNNKLDGAHEIYDLFSFALRKLREFGFHRTD